MMFNPVTVNSIKKVLLKISKVERFEVSDEQIDVIAKASGGDIRNAITSLQYLSLKSHPLQSLPILNRVTAYPEQRRNGIDHLSDGVLLPFGKDATLSLFHALGKFLHNKRETGSLISSGISAAVLCISCDAQAMYITISSFLKLKSEIAEEIDCIC